MALVEVIVELDEVTGVRASAWVEDRLPPVRKLEALAQAVVAATLLASRECGTDDQKFELFLRLVNREQARRNPDAMTFDEQRRNAGAIERLLNGKGLDGPVKPRNVGVSEPQSPSNPWKSSEP